MPCRLWSIERIKGKVLCDVISTILFLDIRRGANILGITMPRFLRVLSALEASLDSENRMLVVATPDRQLRGIFESANILVPAHLGMDDFKKVIHTNFLLDIPSIQARSKKAGRPRGTKSKVRVPESSEQKAEKKAQRESERQAERREKSLLKGIRKASKKVCDETTKVILLATKGSVKCSENAFIRANNAYGEAKIILEEIKENKEAMNEVKKAKAELEKAELVLKKAKQGSNGK